MSRSVLQRAGPHDLGAERLHPSAQLRVGGVDQRRRPIRALVHKFHDSVISSIRAAMPSVNHDEALGRPRHAGRLLPIELNRPYASVAAGQGNDLGDEPSSGPGSVGPPALRPRAHDVVAVHEDSVLRRPGHAVLRSPSCRRRCPESERRPLPCQCAMILGAWARDTMATRIPGSDCADGADCDCAGIRRRPRAGIYGRLIDQCMAPGTSPSTYETGVPPLERGR